MPNTKRGQKPRDVSSGTIPKRRDITDADRHKVIVAILAETDWSWNVMPRVVFFLKIGDKAGVTRFDAEMIAGAAGWSNRAMLEAARDRYAALAGVAS